MHRPSTLLRITGTDAPQNTSRLLETGHNYGSTQSLPLAKRFDALRVYQAQYESPSRIVLPIPLSTNCVVHAVSFQQRAFQSNGPVTPDHHYSTAPQVQIALHLIATTYSRRHNFGRGG